MKPRESEPVHEPVQHSSRLGHALVQVVEFLLPQLAVFVVAHHRGRNPYLELGLVLSQHCSLNAYEDVLCAIYRRCVVARL